jgi:hypothetical protein
MSRLFLAVLVSAVLLPGARAGETVVRLGVQPMAAPKPTLKYQFLPEVRELNPGNPAQWYLRCFMEQRNFFFMKESVEQRNRYQTMALAKLPAEQLRHYGGNALKQADWGARLDAIDWQVLERVQGEGSDLRTPELGPLRVLAAALQVRFRGQVAGRHFDEAAGTAKTMFALARHLGEYPAEAAGRLGLSAAELALATLEEMVQQPGCPNLYWALTDLPCPLVDVRRGVQGDRTRAEADLRLLRDDTPMTEEELDRVANRVLGAMGFAREQAGRPPRSLRAALHSRVKDAEVVRAARVRLIEEGCPVVPALGFRPLQVILLEEKHEYEARRDELLKLLALAPWQIDALAGGGAAGRGGIGLFEELLPDVIPLRRAQGRLEQRVALLRHVEALRLYAAGHGSKLPEKLSDCPVPLPNDPFTGRPFVCQVEGTTAHLRGGAPRGEEQNPAFNVRYEVTLRP